MDRPHFFMKKKNEEKIVDAKVRRRFQISRKLRQVQTLGRYVSVFIIILDEWTGDGCSQRRGPRRGSRSTVGGVPN